MNYYKEHSEEYIKNTFDCDMSVQYRFFEKHLTTKGNILDIGFGSGRDSLYFLNNGYEVYGIDPEESFVEHAKKLGLQNIFCKKAEELEYENFFDGIWACASLLHCDKDTLLEAFKRCYKSLKSNGVVYVSFKYGDFCGERDGRFFIDFTEKTFASFVSETAFLLSDVVITDDVRPGKNDKWLNAILLKNK